MSFEFNFYKNDLTLEQTGREVRILLPVFAFKLFAIQIHVNARLISVDELSFENVSGFVLFLH